MAKDLLVRQQQDRIQAELVKNKRSEEAALAGLEKIRQQRLERQLILTHTGIHVLHFTRPFGG